MPAPFYNLTHSNLRLTSHLFTSNELKIYDIYKHQSYNYQNIIYKPLAYYQEDPINFQINSSIIYDKLPKYCNIQKYKQTSNNNLIVAFYQNVFGFYNIILGYQIENIVHKVAQSGYEQRKVFIPFMKLSTYMSIYTIDYFRRFFFRLDDLLFLSQNMKDIDRDYEYLKKLIRTDKKNLKEMYYTNIEYNIDTHSPYDYNILYHEYDLEKGLVYRIVQFKDWDWFSFDYIKKNKNNPQKLLSIPMLRICDVNENILVSKKEYSKEDLQHVFINLREKEVYNHFKEETKKYLNSISNYTATKLKGRKFNIEFKTVANKYFFDKTVFDINNYQLNENGLLPSFSLIEYETMKRKILQLL